MPKCKLLLSACTILPLLLSVPTAASADDGFQIDEAKWNSEEKRLIVKGKGSEGKTVTLRYAGSLTEIASRRIDGDGVFSGLQE